MGRPRVRKHRDSAEACLGPGDAPGRLKRLTRAELIREIFKLESEKRIGGALPACAPIMLLNGSVRSGQRATYPEGDIIVVGSVGSGAEIAAGGSIHVYGAIRGRAFAGTAGGTGARIFCQKLEAELLAIGEVCRLSDDLDSSLHGQAAHVWCELNRINLAALSNTPEPVVPSEPVDRASVAPQRGRWVAWARRLISETKEHPIAATFARRHG
jgi:hypothetical protein